ncbi:dTMP kinase [Gammaproteobacteria bacterium]|nr:dTMP kinase [Gammaproteobacteria bacterium]
MDQGRFITLEGIEGVGKTTNIEFLRGLLEQKGIDVLVTREPGGTPLAEEVRDVLLKARDESMDAITESLLVFAARTQHVSTVIQPALNEGRWVLCDRYTDATYAYQGGGRGVALETLERLAEFAQGSLWPDLTIYLDAPVDKALARIANRQPDRFETEDSEFFARVRARYLAIEESEERVVLIDATQSIEEVRLRLVDAITDFLEP